eukprot:c23942_g1_i1 orf=405-1982(-)
MLDKGIYAVIFLVFAFVLCLAIWKFWRCLARHKVEGSNISQPLILNIEPDEVPESEALGLETGQTLKRRTVPSLQREDSNRRIKVSQVFESGGGDQDKRQTKLNQGSTITLEVVSGPSTGTLVTRGPGQSLTIGRLPTNNLVVNDPEVSGKHACIKWNSQSFVWDFVDLGSLNGTHLNDQPVARDQSNDGSTRKHSVAIELATGDVVLLGSSTRVLVHVHDIVNGSRSSFPTTSCPVDVGIAADPMALHRGGKRLPMEDVCFYEWPLRGLQEFGVFCIFDGHGGAAAASAASRIMPQKLYDILKEDARRTQVLSNVDATDVLLDAFDATEAALDYEYEGCTATVLLVWVDPSKVLYAQCANVGDSACIFSVDGKYVSMTEDHRLTSISEKSRMLEMGEQLREGETRLCGMNIARVLGDKFLKEQDARFSSKPFVSKVLRITQDGKALAVIASDGLWDVLSQRRAIQMALEAKEGQCDADGTVSKPLSAKSIAEMLISKARTSRTKDNTTVIILDFVNSSKLDLRT